MAAVLHLVVSWLAAFTLVQRLFPDFPGPVRIAAAFCVSTVLTAWVSLGAAMVAHAAGVPDATAAGVAVALAVNAALLVLGRRYLRAEAFAVPSRAALGMLAALLCSGWVVAQRLGGDPLQVSANTWGDTALHIGIARSFSRGQNYPPELPIHSGDPIRYHFGADFYAGTLEKLGLPIDWAFNVLATLGFTAILVLVGALAHELWRSAAVAVVAAVLVLANSSLAFLRYAAAYPTPWAALDPANWWHLDHYPAIAPYQDGEVISIFETLNPYLTQTHLIVGTAIVLLVTSGLVRQLRRPDEPVTRAQSAALGGLAGAAFWINGILVLTAVVPFCVLVFLLSERTRAATRAAVGLGAAAVALFAVGSALDSDGPRIAALAALLTALVLLGDVRRWWPFFVALGLLAAPQLVWLSGGLSATQSTLVFHWGYLVPGFRIDRPGSWLDLVGYWWLNIGLVGPLVVLAAVVVARPERRVLLAIMSIFVFGNVVAFGDDIGGHGHKVFNLWEALVGIFAAYGLVRGARLLWRLWRPAAVVLVPVAATLLVLSGLLDLMVLKNDPRYDVFGDNATAIRWITENTPPDAVFLAADDQVYTVPTLAGRRVYVGGFPGWVEGFGYPDTVARKATVAAVYSAPDRATACAALRATGASYVQVGSAETRDDHFPRRNPALFPGDFVPAWSGGGIAYYDVRASCGTVGTAVEASR